MANNKKLPFVSVPATEDLSGVFEATCSLVSEAVVLTKERKIVYVSPNAMKIFGIKKENDVLGKSTRMFYFNDESFENYGEIQKRQFEEKGFATGIANVKNITDSTLIQLKIKSRYLKEGSSCIVSVFKENSNMSVPSDIVFAPTSVNFSERVSAFRQILDSLNMAILTLDADGSMEYCNAMMQKLITKYSSGSGEKCFQVCEHIWRECSNNHCSFCGIPKVLQTGKSQELIVPGNNGKQWLFSWTPLFDNDQKVVKIIKTICDITKQMQEKNQIENLFLDIFAALPVAIMVFNEKRQIVFMNKAMEDRWGLSFEQVAMDYFQDLEVYAQNTELLSAFDALDRGEENKNLEIMVERHDGRQYLVEASLIHLRSHTFGWQGILIEEDISELSKAKKQAEENLKNREKLLLEQDKMAAIGQLAAGISHELNTPTTYVRGNMQTFTKYTALLEDLLSRMGMQGNSEDNTDVLKKMDKIICNMKDIARSSFEGTTRIMNIISSMRSFVQTQIDVTKDINIYSAIYDGMVLIYNRTKHVGSASVNGLIFSPSDTKILDQKPLLIDGSSSRLSQLFIILFNNAIEAWEGSREQSTPLDIRVVTRQSETMLSVLICDNGGGIDEALLEEIFKPFYTTKAKTSGTGLGLSIARQIAGEHGGTIVLKNTKRGETCAELRLPCTLTASDFF